MKTVILPWLISCLLILYIIINPVTAGSVIFREAEISGENNSSYSRELYDLVWYVHTGSLEKQAPVLIPAFYVVEAARKVLTASYACEVVLLPEEEFVIEAAFLSVDKDTMYSLAYHMKSLSLASWMSLTLSRDEIIAVYLDSFIFTKGITGAEDASLLYYEKDIRELNRDELGELALRTLYSPRYFNSPESLSEDREELFRDLQRAEAFLAQKQISLKGGL